ncbi:MAG: fused MFS/spermidine synthase [Patescibacteria group bacterium]|nr:MAG: fused MFS/spermidine synthase [Patescibacteria group bacterium]
MPKLTFLKRFDLEVIAFTSGASVMTVELVGSRLVAPFLGGSLVVWTTLIGVILACLSLGYTIGGRLADKQPSRLILAVVMAGAGLLIAAVNWQIALVASFSSLMIDSFGLEFASILSALFLFALPSILLGMIPPYAIKLRLTSTGQTGKVAGNLYAISTVGSIVGTFLTGFWWVPTFGSSATLFGVSLALLIIGFLFLASSRFLPYSLMIILVASAAFFYEPNFYFNRDSIKNFYESRYSTFFLLEGTDSETNRPVLQILTSRYVAQSGRFLDGDDLLFPYTRFFDHIFDLNPETDKVLMIGGGAFTYPNRFAAIHPDKVIEVVEIDPFLTELAQKHFNLELRDNLIIHNQDGRLFLNNNEKKYDAVLLDAFSSAGSVPFQLATTEAVEMIYDSLNDNGVVIVNVIGATEGKYARFVEAQFAVYQEVFGQAIAYPLKTKIKENEGEGKDLINIMIVAIKNPDEANKEQSLEQESYTPNPARVLTDDWAPVDYYVSGIL